MATVEKKLKEMKIEYVQSRVEEGGICVDQLFFHDPDGSMIEICNCDNLPVIPLGGGGGDTTLCSRINCNVQQQQQLQLAAGQIKQQQVTCLPSIPINEEYLPCAWYGWKVGASEVSNSLGVRTCDLFCCKFMRLVNVGMRKNVRVT